MPRIIPIFQLYDFNFTDDIRLIAREDGLISVNNALAVDLTGQVGSESIGHQMYTGTGGQTAFGVGASLAGGKSIIVLPATAMVEGPADFAYRPDARAGHRRHAAANLRALRGDRVRNREAQGQVGA